MRKLQLWHVVSRKECNLTACDSDLFNTLPTSNKELRALAPTGAVYYRNSNNTSRDVKEPVNFFNTTKLIDKPPNVEEPAELSEISFYHDPDGYDYRAVESI